MNHYPEFFRAGIQRTLQHCLAQLQVGPADPAEGLRTQALHILSFALKVDEAWPLTRALLLDLAPRMEQMGPRADWLPYLAGGIQCSQRQGDLLAEAELAYHLGHLQRLLSNFALAQRWLESSLELFTRTQQPQGQARVLNQLAYLAFLQREYAQATIWVQAAQERLSATDPEQATALNTLGVLAAAAQQWVDAERYHRQALQIRQQQGDTRRAAWSLQNLGSVLREQGNYAEALAWYHAALVALEALADGFNTAIVAMNLGIVYAQQGDHPAALVAYDRAADSFQKMSNHFYLAKVQVNAGLSYLAVTDWQRAETAFLTGATLFRELGDRREAGNALDGLGLVYLHQGWEGRACATFAQALAQLAPQADAVVDQTLYEEVAAHWQQAQIRLGQGATSD